MSARSKRLAKFLKEELGWEVGDEATKCKKCRRTSYPGDHFCCDCGAVMSRVGIKKQVIDELETAMAFALKEGK